MHACVKVNKNKYEERKVFIDRFGGNDRCFV